jgi:hypothetical protein
MVGLLAMLGQIGYFGRILAVGLGRRSPAVAAGGGTLPTWPIRGGLRAGDLGHLWRANRAPVAAIAVALLSALALATASGWLGGLSTASGGPPRAPAPSPVPSTSPSPSVTPSASPSVTVPPTLSPSSEPSTPASPDASAGASGAPSGAPPSGPTASGALSSAEPSFVPVSPAPAGS